MAWLAKRRSQLDALKLAAGCIDCGYAGHPAVLQWDHRDRSAKVANVGAMVGWAWAKVLAEMAKCDVRCANCHAIKTAGEGYGEGRPRIYPRSA
ncbi:MAG: hypothetical protein SHS37scaffold145_21 [Phage 71_18]|nr:MAG: hypothetical protein SHS37scaffold145_21 [Phage 71_18]